jgi:DNA-directed RNA polymerase III subunit RPC8
MFILTVIEDEVALHPSRFGVNKHVQAIREMIEDKYIDKVIPDAGLVVSLYDIVEVRDAYIFPGDLKDSQGDAACTVVFRLVVFRPRIGELVLGRVHSSTPMGLQVNLGFFQDVTIPANQLREPCVYDERLNTWVWEYRDEKGHAVPYPYIPGEPICLRVTSVQFTDSVDSSLNATRRAQAMNSAQKPMKGSASSAHAHAPHEEPPMLVVGSVQEDGLGLQAWWI